MAQGIDFPEANFAFGPPAWMTEEEVYTLRVRRTAPAAGQPGTIVSCWQLTPEELAEVQRTGVVWLEVWGSGISPMLVTGHRDWVLAGKRQ